MLAELKKLIEANPLFRDKLQFPTLKNSRLRTLINQRLEHQLKRYCFPAYYIEPNHFRFRELENFVKFSLTALQFELATPTLQKSQA